MCSFLLLSSPEEISGNDGRHHLECAQSEICGTAVGRLDDSWSRATVVLQIFSGLWSMGPDDVIRA